MSSKIRALAAHTTYANSPESDLQENVMHSVNTVSPTGSTEWVQLMANEPGQAIDLVNRMSEEAFAALPRISEEAHSLARSAKNRP